MSRITPIKGAFLATAALLLTCEVSQAQTPPDFPPILPLRHHQNVSVSSDAASVTYTPPGAGAVQTNVARRLDREIWVNDRGAACNGAGDDRAAIQSAIDEGIATGAAVRYMGPCAFNGTLYVTGGIDFSSGGPPDDQPNGTGAVVQSRLLATNPSVSGIIVTTASAVHLHDFSLSYTSPTANQPALSINPTSGINTSSKLERLNVYGGQSCLYFNNTQLFNLSSSQISCSGTAITVAGTVNPDAGDSTMHDVTLQAGNQGTALLWQGSGGLRFENNKINQNTPNPAQGLAFGIRLAPALGVRTSDIFVNGSSIEGLNNTTNGYGIFAQRGDTISSVGNLIITANEIVGRGCIYIPTDAVAAWMGNVIVSDNACGVSSATSAGSFGISIDGVVGLSIHGNVISNGGPISTAIGSGAQGETAATCAITFNPHTGNFGPSAPGACTTATPF
jgi:hypothetical protein